MSLIKETLRQFCAGCRDHLNDQQIPTKVGRHKLELSTRTLSDVTEKLVIDYMIDYFGSESVSHKSWQGYDAILTLPEEIFYLNMKAYEYTELLDATWLFSASVVPNLGKRGVLGRLYCLKFEYLKQGRDYLEFVSGKVAGPISEVPLISYTKGDPKPCRLRAEFNGTHCHIPNEFYA